MNRPGRVLLLVFALIVFAGLALAQPSKQSRPLKLDPRDLTAGLIGHAHIDLAWLWRWEETVHDVATHTFLGTLAQMDKMPGLTFAQSQAAIYEAVEENYPELFRMIRAKIRQGTWIPVGGMWVEPDLNMPDGESLARQLLYGKRYFLDKFGVDVTVGWNPDSFGHNFQLPQILSRAGMRSYVFERCAPANAPVFRWEGADGSRVLAYVPPGWYLVDLKKGVRDLLLETAGKTPLRDFMLLYGAGDHGGGPRDSDVAAIAQFKKEKDHPRVEFISPEEYFRRLEGAKIEFPVIKRELNFTFPACYTTQAETKKSNRSLESLLLAAEKFSALAAFAGYRDYYPERDLDEAWKIVLRNQFHDILDGSSIGPVYDEARRFYEAARARAQRALDFSLETIANAVDTRGEGSPLLVFNSLFWERTGPVESEARFSHPVEALKIMDSEGADVPFQLISGRQEEGGWVYRFVFIAEKVPSFGYKSYRLLETGTAPQFTTQLSVGDTVMENEFLRLTLDPATGWLKSLFDKKINREVLAGEGNVLEAIADEPESMSAWQLGLKETIGDIGAEGARVEVVERGPVRGLIRVTSPFRNSRFIQDIILYQGIPRLDCRTRLDWQERNVMVKAAFPAALINASAAFEIPFGFVSRPTDGTEVPALRWIDLTDESGGYGLSLINDSKYGFDVKGGRARISIIHGATSPDPEADRGEHELLYSIFPHAGSWQAAGTHRKGYELNNPLLARVGMAHQGTLPPTHSFIQAGPENAVVSSLKKETGYESRAMILRIYETFGKPAQVELSFPWSIEAWETDLIERPLSKMDSGVKMLSFSLKPFEIRTIKLISRPRR